MALNVGELYTELSIDVSRFTQGLDQSRNNLGDLETAARRAGQVAQQSNDATVASYARMANAARDAGRASERAQDQAAQAAEVTRIAEERLREVRRTGGDVAAAERRVTEARRDQQRATERAAAAVDQLEAASRRAAASARDIDFDRLRREAERAGDATRDIDINSGLRGAAENAANAIGRIGDTARNVGSRAGNDLGGGIMGGVSGQVAGLGSKAGPIGIALAGIAAVGLGAGAVLAGAIKDGMQQQADLALIQAQLGVNEVAMTQIGRAAAESYKAGWGESVADVAGGIRDAMEAGLLNGEELAPEMAAVSNQLQTVAKVMDEDVSAAARAAGQAVKTGMVDSPAEAMDLLVKAQQKGLNVADDMLDTTTEYGTQFRQVGLSGVEAFALMSQAVENGARDADTAADAIKEFAIRSIDGSKASAEAYVALGLSAEDMTAQIAQGGEAAHDGMQLIFQEMNKLTDPVERNAVAVGLFGTKAEDLGEAMFSMNLDTAVREFGLVEGAATRAGNTIQNTTAAKIEQAQRSIEVSMNGVKGSLAEAFGPTLEKVAAWVENNQPQIIGFFGSLADGAFACLDGIASFASGALEYFATMAEGSAEFIGGMLDNLGGLASGLGSVIKHIPGMESTGNALEGVGSAMQGYRETMTNAASTMREWAGTIDNTVRPGLASMRESVAENTQAAENSALMFQALGDTVEAVPTEHGIAISDNSPETITRLEALNLKTRTLDDGTVEVYADTAEGQRIIDDFVAANNGKDVNMYVSIAERRAAAGVPAGFVGPTIHDAGSTAGVSGGGASSGSFADGAITESYADGKMPLAGKLPDQAVIQAPRPRFIQWAEPETHGEVFMPLAPSKRERSTRILAQAAAIMGYSILPTEHAKVFHGDPDSLDDRSDPTGWRRFLGGDYTPAMGAWAGSEDSGLVDAMFGARAMLADGDYDGSLARFGIQEDHPLVDALLGAHRVMVQSFADGAITGSPVDGLVALAGQHAPALSITDTHRPGADDHHGAGKAVDFSNGSGNTDEMLAWANYLADNYQAHLRELIYDDPRFDRNIKDGKIVPRSFYAGAGDHTHHVHAASDIDLRTIDIDTMAGADTRTPQQRNVDAVIAEGKRRGMSDKDIRTAVATMLAESGGKNLANNADPDTLGFEHDGIGSDHDSSGIFQQRNNGAWGTAADRMDPTKAAGMFYDELAKVEGRDGMTEAELAQAVQRSAISDGSNYAAQLEAADKLIAESNARGNGASSGTSGSSGIADGTRVYVTNWPSGMGGSSTTSSTSSTSSTPSTPAPPAEDEFGPHDISTPAGRASLMQAIGARFFANGGFGGPGAGAGEAQIASAGSWRVFGEPETGDEAYIPLSSNPAQRERSLAIWRTTGQRLGAFAAGAALTAASGWDADGNFVGFDTAGGTIPGLERILADLTERIQPQPAVVIEHAEINDPEEFVADSAANNLAHRFPILQTNL